MKRPTCPPEHGHGLSTTCYNAHGCRCTACCAYAAERRSEPPRIPAGRFAIGPVRRHVLRLMRGGVRSAQVAHAAGLPALQVRDILRKQSLRTVDADVAARLLGVDLHQAAAAPVRGRYPATGSRRRVEALAYLGWTPELLEHRTGIPARVFAAPFERDSIAVSDARAIARAHALLWFVQPMPRHAHDRAAIERTRSEARRRGFVSALAWDDIDHSPAPHRSSAA